MKRLLLQVLAVMLSIFTSMSMYAADELLAFPGAEGFGRYTTGGRGGEIYHVTNLNDSGKGSLRDAVSQPNRIIIFDVAGTIYLKSVLTFSKNLTILGQTAPGEGIQVYGHRVTFSGANNIIVRHMRFRLGRYTPGVGQVDAAGVAYGRDMIFDHLSVLWGLDENFSISWDSKKTDQEPTNITIQNSIIGQGLQSHSCGGLIQTNGGVTLYRNLYIENKTRNPKVKGLNQFVNNVLYNWGDGGAYILGGDSEGDSWAHIEGNYFIKGNWIGATKPLSRGNLNFQYFAQNNYYDDNKDGELNGHEMTDAEYDASASYRVTEFNKFNPEVPAPREHPVISNLMKPEEAVKWAIDSVGPSLPARDEVDWYLIDELKSFGPNSTTGGISTELTLPHGGTGVIHGGYLPTDTDGDGIPDSWENANGLDPEDPSDAAKIAANGYANIENYVNSLTTGHPYIKIPQELKAYKQGQNYITLTWVDPADNEDGFTVEISTDGKEFKEAGSVDKDVTTMTVDGLTRETAYFFRVYAHNKAGVKSLYSDVLATETTGDEVAPDASKLISPEDNAELGAMNDVVLKWSNDTKPHFGEVKYSVYLGTDANALPQVVKDLTTKEYNAGKLKAWTTYYWRVDATNNIGTTSSTTGSFKVVAGGEMFYCDFYTVPESWAKTYGDITANTNIINAAAYAKKTVGDMEFGGGKTTMRIVALFENNVAASGDYSPNTTADAGASPRAVQFTTEAEGGYMLTPWIEGPVDITLYAGNPGAKTSTFYLLSIDEDGTETQIGEFSMVNKKRTFKFTLRNAIDDNKKVRYKIDANAVKLNINDFKIDRYVDMAGVQGVGADAEGVAVFTVGDAVTVNNLTPGSTVVITDLAGRVVVKERAVSTSHSYVLAGGVYLVSVNGRNAVKIVI
ncbi:MAG: fibronectin type III domain-containing protein [Muribaculaceae bacterium]|nr:fibronectin type III domain-containing protein [Muribaculaceae bacterium]